MDSKLLEMLQKIKKSLILHEDIKNFPYFDTKGKITIGVGYNLTDRGISDEWIYSQLQNDIEFFYKALSSKFKFFEKLNEDRQVVLIDMCFNMGFKKFMTFKRMLDALDNQNYEIAANEMINSLWATQVGKRAQDLSKGMRKGVYNL